MTAAEPVKSLERTFEERISGVRVEG